MGLKILHTADWHMDTPFVSMSEEQREFLHREQRKLPGKIADICRRECCDLVLLAGDIFDGTPSAESVDTVKKALKECGVPVFISPGNHDFYAPGSSWQVENWPDNVHIFTDNMGSVTVPELDCRVYGAGYHSMDCEPLLEGFRAEAAEKYQIAVLHGDPVTSRSPYCAITAGQVRDSGLQYLALGHIHKAGKFRSGSTLCAWPGCPMGRGWDEAGQKGVCLVTCEEETVVQFVPLDVPRFYDLEADVSENVEAVLDRLLPAAESWDFFRITLTGQTEVDMETVRKRYTFLPNLILRDRTESPEDLWAEAGSDSFRGVYFSLLRDRAGEDPRAVLAAEISRKILSGREVKLP